MVGSAIVRKLAESGYDRILTCPHNQLDLCNQEAVRAFFEQNPIDYVFLAAAKVGGIYANNRYPADFIYRNLMIEANVIWAAWQAQVKRLLFLGSSCIYPKESPQPMDERCLLAGKLEPTNEPYAIAKISGIKLCESFNRQYATDCRSVMPTNLYGPNDNYDLKDSHVLPAMIRKFHLARLAQKGDWDGMQKDSERYGAIPADFLKDLVMIGKRQRRTVPDRFAHLVDDTHPAGIGMWGTGKAKREFLHVDDLADACLFVMNLDKQVYDRYTRPMTSHINVGTGIDMTIQELARTVSAIVGYQGGIYWDETKPDGTMQKLLDVMLMERIGWTAGIPLDRGIADAYADYLRE